MVATLVTKATYAMLDDGRLELARKQHRVQLGRSKIDGLEFPPEVGYGKVGVDVLAVARAFAPNGAPAQAIMAGLSIDDTYLGVAVIGDRRWEKRWPGHIASDPQPFCEMPITWARAYGGCARVRGSVVPCVDNMLGKGYVLEEDAAEGVELPNIEGPAQLIRRPTDQPRPVSLCPLPHYTTALEHIDEDGRGLSKDIYNVAIPAHRLPRYMPGATLRLHHLTPGPCPEFRLPAINLVAEVSMGTARYEFGGGVDTILVVPTQRQIVLTHRIVFRYDYARGMARVVRLRTTERMRRLEGARV
jgi:hypothetical protein